MFSPSVFVGWTYDSNIFDVEDGLVITTSGNEKVVLRASSDTIAVARPKLGFKLPFSHSYASLVYAPAYREYGSARSPLHTSHQLTFETRLNFANGSTILIKDDYLNSFADLRGPVDSENLQFSSTPYHRNSPEIELDWVFASGWGVAGILERTSFVVDRTEVIDFVSQTTGERQEEQGLFDFFDYVSDSVELRGYRNLGRYRLFTSVSVGRTDQDRRKFNESRADLNNCSGDEGDGTTNESCNSTDFERISQRDASVGVKGRLLRKTEGEMEISYTSWKFKEGEASSFSGLSISTRMTHTFDRRTVGFLHLERSPLQASGILTGYYVFDRVGFNVERLLTRSFSTKVGLDYQRTSFPGSSGEPAFTVADYVGDLQVVFRPAQAARQGRFVTVLSYRPDFQRSDRREKGLDENSHRIGLSLQYGWF